MARTYQSEGWYKFPPLWSAGTEVSCRGQFRIAAMSVTAVLESRVLNSRPVTLLYTYLPCPPHHLPFSPSLSATLPLSLLPSLSSRFPDRFIFSPRSFQYTYIYIHVHTYVHLERSSFLFERSELSSNRTRQSVITKRAHESLVYSLTVKTKYLSVNSVFSFSSELNVALPRSIQTFLDIYFYDYFSVYFSNSVRVRVCVCARTRTRYLSKRTKREFCDKASMRCMPGSCLTGQLPGKLGPSRRVLDGFPTTFLFSRARLSLSLAYFLSGERREKGFHECVGFLGSFFVPISFVYELNSV